MPSASEKKTVSKRFADLLQRAESTDAYHVDRLKVEISERIYKAMKEQDVSNAELARRLGKSRSYVTKLLRGTANLTLESLVRIGRALSSEVELELLPKGIQTKASAASKLVRNSSATSPAKGKRKRSNKHSSKPSLFG